MPKAEDEQQQELYRSRYAICDDCECVTIIQRNDDRGVPEEIEWEEFGRCLVCGGSLMHFDADVKTQDDIYWALGRRSLQLQLDDEREAKRVAAEAADRFRDVLTECVGLESNPGDDELVRLIRARSGKRGPEPTRWRDFLEAQLARLPEEKRP